MNNLVNLLGREVVKVAHLERIYAATRDNPSLACDAISAMRQLDSNIAWRAVWLLKRMAREHNLGEDDLSRLACCADEMSPSVHGK